MTAAEIAEIRRLAEECLVAEASVSREWAYSDLRNCFDTTQIAEDGTLHDAAEIGVLHDSEPPSDSERVDLRFAVFARNSIATLARAILRMLPVVEAAVALRLADADEISPNILRDTAISHPDATAEVTP